MQIVVREVSLDEIIDAVIEVGKNNSYAFGNLYDPNNVAIVKTKLLEQLQKGKDK